MLLGTYFVIIVTLLYLGGTIAYVWQGQYGSALMFFGYCFANVGFLYQTGIYPK